MTWMIGAPARCAAFCLVALGALERDARAADDLVVETDVVYGEGGDEDLKLDLFRPAGQKEKLPGVVVIHGGGWRGGRKEQMRPFAEQVARAGYVAASIQYRLTPKHKFPAQIEDAKCAVRWLRANSGKYLIDADKIGAFGASAGGHLALMLGMVDAKDGLEGTGGHLKFSSKVQVVVNYFGPADLTLLDWDPGVEVLLVDFLGDNFAKTRESYRRASPLAYLDKSDAPTITFHGTMDPIVPYGQAILLDRRLREAGVESRLEVMIGESHGWLGTDLHRTQELALEFAGKHLKGKAPAKK